jgi:hypothetical protein
MPRFYIGQTCYDGDSETLHMVFQPHENHFICMGGHQLGLPIYLSTVGLQFYLVLGVDSDVPIP